MLILYIFVQMKANMDDANLFLKNSYPYFRGYDLSRILRTRFSILEVSILYFIIIVSAFLSYCSELFLYYYLIVNCMHTTNNFINSHLFRIIFLQCIFATCILQLPILSHCNIILYIRPIFSKHKLTITSIKRFRNLNGTIQD